MMRVHFIAIGGAAMHNLAIALHLKGYEISGSDDVIFEPSKSRLEKYGLLPAKMGWDVDNIQSDYDVIILGMHAQKDNPELLKAQELGLNICSYPEYIYRQSKTKTRVVIGGSHGKTTITSMILHVMRKCGRECDYLVGAQLEGFDTMVRLTDTAPVIIIEGDEYLASPIDKRPKFHIYKAHVAVISGIAWDHINVFPTFENYIDQFRKFLGTVMDGGKVIYCAEDEVLNKVINEEHSELYKIPYGTPDYTILDGTTTLVTQDRDVVLTIFGRHNLMNLNAAKMVCNQLNISDNQFYDAISSFSGAARRLELLGKNSQTTVYKDFAHSPSKLKATIEAVKQQYPDRILIALMELHTYSSLNREFLNEYKGCMDGADQAIVFIDHHTFLQKKIEPYDEATVKSSFNNGKLKFFNNPDILVGYLHDINYRGKNFLLMSSGNFGGIDLKVLAKNILAQ
jgi:UDP-N-acetylmuramate: L-alanyl-gamma-D-glutamyl-meso-diaminopimelate ligase